MKGVRHVFYRFCWILVRFFLESCFGFTVHCRWNVPGAAGAIMAVNHASYLDPMAVAAGMTRPLSFMARRSLFNGLFGRLIAGLNAFPIDRGGIPKNTLREFVSLVRGGACVLVFPEGTRTRNGLLGTMDVGVGGLVARTEAPVVPTYVAGTFSAWPRHCKWPRRGSVEVYYGRAMTFERREGETSRVFRERVTRTIEVRLRALEARALRSRPWVKRDAEIIELLLAARSDRDGLRACCRAALPHQRDF